MVTVIIEVCIQVSSDDYRLKRYSRNFATNRTLDDMLSWAKSMGVKNASVNDLIFSDYTGSSL